MTKTIIQVLSHSKLTDLYTEYTLKSVAISSLVTSLNGRPYLSINPCINPLTAVGTTVQLFSKSSNN